MGVINSINRENCILATFLYADDLGLDKSKAFILNSNIFTSSYKRATADKINDELNGDNFLGMLSLTLEDKTKGTSYEQEWIDILSQTPMTFEAVKVMHLELEKEYKIRIAKEFR